MSTAPNKTIENRTSTAAPKQTIQAFRVTSSGQVKLLDKINPRAVIFRIK